MTERQEPKTNALPSTEILRYVEPKFYEDVVRYALDQRASVSDLLRRKLNAAIRHSKVRPRGGFHHEPWRAPTSILFPCVCGRAYKDPQLFSALLGIWFAGHSELREHLKPYLLARGIPIQESSSELLFLGRWSFSSVESLRNDYLEENEDVKPEDVSLMVCCLAGLCPEPSESMPDIEPLEEETISYMTDASPNSTILTEDLGSWQQILDQTATWSADNPAWEKLDAFIHKLHALASLRQEERSAPTRQIEVALAQFREKCGSISDFEVDVDNWNVEYCQVAHADEICNALMELSTLVLRYRELETNQPKEIRQRATWHLELGESTQEIHRLHLLLTSRFSHRSPIGETETVTGSEDVDDLFDGDKLDLPPEEESNLPTINSDDLSLLANPLHSYLPPEQEDADSDGILDPISIEDSPTTATADVIGTDQVADITPVEDATEPPLRNEASYSATQSDDTKLQQVIEPHRDEVLIEHKRQDISSLESVKEGPLLSAGFEASSWVATYIPENASIDADNHLLYCRLLRTLVAEGDIPSAYWLARALEDAGYSDTINSQLLALLQGGQWISSEIDPLVSSLRVLGQELSGSELPNEPVARAERELLLLSACLRPALVAPATDLSGLLHTPSAFAEDFDPLVKAVSAFARHYQPLDVKNLNHVESMEECKKHIKERSDLARIYLRERNNPEFSYGPARDVWHLFFNDKLKYWLTIVQENQSQHHLEIYDEITPYLRDEILIDSIDMYRKQLLKTKDKPIVSATRDRFVRMAREIIQLVADWCHLTSMSNRDNGRKDTWVLEQINTLRSSVASSLPNALHSMSQFLDEKQENLIVSAIMCMSKHVLQLAEMLSLPIQLDGSLPTYTSTALPSTDWWVKGHNRNLNDALKRRLLWLPEVYLAPETSEVWTFADIAPAIRNACLNKWNPVIALDGWVVAQDFRFLEDLLELVPGDVEHLRRQSLHSLDSCRDSLRDLRRDTQDDITQAIVDGVIGEAERARYEETLERIIPDTVLNIRHEYRVLEQVRSEIQSDRKRHLDTQRQEWTILVNKLKNHVSTSTYEQANQYLHERFSQQDSRVATECMDHVRQALDEGTQIDETFFSPNTTADEFVDFVNYLRQFDAVETLGADFLSTITTEDSDSLRVLQNWQKLKKIGKVQEDELQALLNSIWHYAGILSTRSTKINVSKSNLTHGWIEARMETEPREGVSGIPHFGRRANGRFDVVCLWNNQRNKSLEMRLTDIGRGPRELLIIFLGPLSYRNRCKFAQWIRKRNQTVALLDEVLLAYLIQVAEDRRSTFLRCTLPFAPTNPYIPFAHGDVNPEMFFGRDLAAQELQEDGGKCIVYGGRQLGKSALLMHTQRQYHNKDDERYAWVGGIRNLGDPMTGEPPEHIWRKIHEGLLQLGLVRQGTSGKPETVIDQVRRALNERPQRRILFLLDEADKFLDADAKNNFREVNVLRDLITESSRRLKIVFAGLHDVQRFAGIANQPFAQFGGSLPIEVGPLEAKAAIDLASEPFKALGFRFDNEATILSVLSYTNYHAGLIQLFCQRIYEHIQTQNVRVEEYPRVIRRADVEAVYRQQEVRNNIEDRFNLTLALDLRYELIACALIEAQIKHRDSYCRAFEVSEILELAQLWWENGFREMEEDEMTSLLNEMRGLGILIADPNGRYRLRSPNLVRLLGTSEAIYNRLKRIGDKAPPPEVDVDSLHAVLSRDKGYWSPLTFRQERALNPPRPNVGIIFASHALGYGLLDSVAQAFLPAEAVSCGEAECILIPDQILSPSGSFLNWLRQTIDSRTKRIHIVFYHRMREMPLDFPEQIESALAFCRSRKDTRKNLTILFMLGVRATQSWLQVPRNRRTPIEERTEIATYPRQWNVNGIRLRLQNHGDFDSEDVADVLFEQTNGWPWLLDYIFNNCQRNHDPRLVAESLYHDLGTEGTSIREEFRVALGITRESFEGRLLTAMVDANQIIRLSDVPVLLELNQIAATPEDMIRGVEFLKRMGCISEHLQELCVDVIVQRVWN